MNCWYLTFVFDASRMEIVGIEHENTILELKEKVQKLKRKVEVSEEQAADRGEDAKNLAIRLAVSCLFLSAKMVL